MTTSSRHVNWTGAVPDGFSRESKIRVDADGRFFHEGILVEHPGLHAALASWVSRHPDDGRWVLENGWDWCYLQVDDVPLVAQRVRVVGDELLLTYQDGLEEAVELQTIHLDPAGGLRCEAKREARGGPYPAKLGRQAMLSLVDLLEESAQGVRLHVGTQDIALVVGRANE